MTVKFDVITVTFETIVAENDAIATENSTTAENDAKSPTHMAYYLTLHCYQTGIVLSTNTHTHTKYIKNADIVQMFNYKKKYFDRL